MTTRQERPVILAIVVACEIGFWVLIAAGLAVRYLLRKPKLGAVLLAGSPVLDALLLVVTGIDLARGATATFAHSLAAVYLGFSITYGHRLVRWADIRFAHRFAGGPAPVTRYGSDYARLCWADVLRTLGAAAIAAAVLGLLILIAGDQDRSASLLGTFRILGIVCAVDLVWAISYTVWPRKAPAVSPADGR